MQEPASIRVPPRSMPEVRRIVSAWRRLTGAGNARTLVACSGGADSAAVVLALVAAGGEPVVGHVVHDLRPADEAEADRIETERLAGQLGLMFSRRHVEVRARGGNAEAAARRLRYTALAEMARASACPFVATGHQGDDQLETLVLAMTRGAGPRGLAGIAERRQLDHGIVLIRPALDVSREGAEAVCRAAAYEWREDTTNRDLSRARAAVRALVLPELRRIRPQSAGRAVATARLMRDVARLIDENAERVVGSGSWDDGKSAWGCSRELLRRENPAVLGDVVRGVARGLTGARGADRRGLRHLSPALRYIRGPGTEPKRFELSGVDIVVTSRDVRICRKDDHE